MRITGIIVCVLAMLAVSAPSRAQDAKPADAVAAKKASPSKAKSAKKAPAPLQQSFITFYWPGGSSGSLFGVFKERVAISVDGQPAGKLSEGETTSIPVQPGNHTYGYERLVAVSEGEIKRSVDVRQGQTVYLQIEEKDQGFVHPLYLQEVGAEIAQAEVSKLKAPLNIASKEEVMQAAPAPNAGAAAAPGARAAAAPGKKGAQPQQAMQNYITFYWPKRTEGLAAFMDTLADHVSINIDGQPAGNVSEGQYISVPVQPGSHTYAYARTSQISVGQKTHTVDVAPGQSAYFEIAERSEGMITVLFPQQVSAEQGQQALASLKQPGRDE